MNDMTDMEVDQEILDAAREVLRRHGHGIGLTQCTRACQWGGRIPYSVLEAEWDAKNPGVPWPLRAD